MSADAFLRMEGIDKRYGGTIALKNVSVGASSARSTPSSARTAPASPR